MITDADGKPAATAAAVYVVAQTGSVSTPQHQQRSDNNNTAGSLRGPSVPVLSSSLSALAGHSVRSSSSTSNGLGSSVLLAGNAGRGTTTFAPYSGDAPKLAGSVPRGTFDDEEDGESDEGSQPSPPPSVPFVPGGPSPVTTQAPVSQPTGVPGSSSEIPILIGVAPAGNSSTATKRAPTLAVREGIADKLAFDWVMENRLRAGLSVWEDVVRNRTLARKLVERKDFLTKNERVAAGPIVGFTTLLPSALVGPNLLGPLIIPTPPGNLVKVGSTAALKRKATADAQLEANKRHQAEAEAAATAKAVAAAAAAAEAAAEDEEEEGVAYSVDNDPHSDDEAPLGAESTDPDDKSGDPDPLIQWTKVPLSDELKAVVPPSWWKPAKATAVETAKSTRLREAEELAFTAVPLIKNDKARRVIVVANSIPTNAITWPRAYVPDKELKDVKSETHLHSKQLYKLLKTELPAVVNRDADVLGVVLALTNTLASASIEDVKAVLTNALIPLLIDNNMRTSDVLQRYALELFGIKTEAASTGKSEIINASSYELPLMRHHLDTKKAEEKVAKSLAKLQSAPTSRPPSSSSTSSKRGRGNSNTHQFNGPTSHGGGRGGGGGGGWHNRPSTRGNGRGGGSSRGFSRGSSRGGARGRGARGGGRGSTKPQDF